MSRRPVGSIRWRSPGVARVELQAGFDPITGKPRRMSETVHGTEADAERALARMMISIGQMPAGKKMTVRDYILDIYLPGVAGRVRRETLTGYRAKLEGHVIPKLGDQLLTSLEPYTLDRWRDELLTKMEPVSAMNVYRAFSVALNKAVRWRLITANPLKAVDPPRAKLRILDTLAADEALSYLEAFDGHTLQAVVVIALASGLRPCEIYGLKWSDIDLKAGELQVQRGLHERKGDSWMEPPKSDRSHRTVSLPAWAVETLKPLRGIGPLIPGDGAEGHARPTVVAREYRRQIRQAGLRYMPIRDLRHSHATLMLEAGVDIVAVSRRLGHSTVAITDKYYLRPKQSADQTAAAAFDQMLARTGVNRPVAVRGVKSTGDNE